MFARDTSATRRALDAAIEHARGAPFYAKRLPDKPPSSLAAFARWPLLDKATAAAHQEQLRVKGVRGPDAMSAAGTVSSATTREGRPLRILRSPDEGPAGHDPAGHPPAPPPAVERTVRIASPRHGVQWPTRDNQVLLPATWHDNTVDVLCELLAETKDPVRGLVAPVSSLKFITVVLARRGQPVRHRLKGIGTTGYPLTAHARAWMERVWNVPLYDNYSLSELPGYAFTCEACGHQHWDGAPTLFELIDPVTLRPTRARWGELVATTLPPEVKLMPLVRYRTGDLVKKGPRCPRQGEAGLRFCGRTTDSLVTRRAGRAHLVVGGRDLLEWGEMSVEVGQVPHPAERLGRIPPGSGIGVPKVVLRDRTIHAELRVDPAVYPDRAAVVRQQLRELWRPPVPRDVKVRLHGPGALDLERWALKL